jgi:hypothetical protein
MERGEGVYLQMKTSDIRELRVLAKNNTIYRNIEIILTLSNFIHCNENYV